MASEQLAAIIDEGFLDLNQGARVIDNVDPQSHRRGALLRPPSSSDLSFWTANSSEQSGRSDVLLAFRRRATQIRRSRNNRKEVIECLIVSRR
jgi:hypothetical protein